MTKTYLYSLFIFLLIVPNLYGQSVRNKIEGRILDKKTQLPLQYSVLADYSGVYGYYSDSNGRYTLYYNSLLDSIRISNLGYQTSIIRISELIKNPEVLLEPIEKITENVDNLSNKIKGREYEVGHFSVNPSSSQVIIYLQNTWAVFISNSHKNKNSIIKSMNLNYIFGINNVPVKIRILNVRPDGTPGEDLLNQNVIFLVPKDIQKRTAKINVSEYNISLPKFGVFLVFEWITDTTPIELRKVTGITGPYIGVIKKTESDPFIWSTSYNSTKWSECKIDNILAAGLTLISVK
jgi:hypothetical protein